MSDEFTNTELLNQYLDDELDSPAKILLEKRLIQESKLREELEQLKLAREAVRLYGIKEQVRSIRAGMKQNDHLPTARRGIVRSMSRWSLRVAAAIIVLVSAYGIYEYLTLSGDKMYTQLYTAYEVRATRGDREESAVVSSYRNKDYSKTIADFNSIPDQSVANHFFVAQAYLQLNNTDQAIVHLEKVLEDSSHDYKDEAEFYLALAYLKANQLSQAHALFTKIHSDPNHLFHDRVSSWYLKKLSLLERK